MYIVLEHFGGKRFVEMKMSKGILNEDEWRMIHIQRFMFYTLSGIAFLHSQGFVHGELCPEDLNIFDDGTIKIDTLRLPQIRGNEQSTHLLTDPIMIYCAPEVQTGEIPTMQSDIWSLGVILLENIAQIHPFKGSSHAETLMNIRNGRLNSITPIPKDVGDLIMKMISVSPQKRPSASDLLKSNFIKAYSLIELKKLKTKGEILDELRIAEYRQLQAQEKSLINVEERNVMAQRIKTIEKAKSE
ncbi:MAG: hypothetical protein EZS28_048537, partial [Streblomastix strix]